jgi:1-pyrroline-5-carboxylate dehydrogenase
MALAAVLCHGERGVAQQPFGGGRASGTNDKPGSAASLLRWTSPRSMKEALA